MRIDLHKNCMPLPMPGDWLRMKLMGTGVDVDIRWGTGYSRNMQPFPEAVEVSYHARISEQGRCLSICRGVREQAEACLKLARTHGDQLLCVIQTLRVIESRISSEGK